MTFHLWTFLGVSWTSGFFFCSFRSFASGAKGIGRRDDRLVRRQPSQPHQRPSQFRFATRGYGGLEHNKTAQLVVSYQYKNKLDSILLRVKRKEEPPRASTRTSVTLPRVSEALGQWAAKNGIKRAYSMVSDFGPGHDAEQGFQRTFVQMESVDILLR